MTISHNNKEYVRVSTVLKPYTNFDDIDPVVLDRKRDIGTDVHDAIEDCVTNELPILTSMTWGYFKSFLLWRDTTQAVFTHSEERYFDDQLRLTGKIDALVRFGEDYSSTLVDYKTSAAESPTWVMQAHLYHLLLCGARVHVRPRFLFIKLDKKGKYPHVFEYFYSPKTHAECVQAVQNYWREREKDCR